MHFYNCACTFTIVRALFVKVVSKSARTFELLKLMARYIRSAVSFKTPNENYVHFSGLLKLTELHTNADDVHLYVTQSSDINIINSILSTYQSVSNAKVNWTKSCGLKMNGWDVGLNCKLCI